LVDRNILVFENQKRIAFFLSLPIESNPFTAKHLITVLVSFTYRF